MDKTLRGAITSLHSRFGFITDSRTGQQLFFDRRALRGATFEDLSVGEPVAFTPSDSVQGPAAEHVETIQPHVSR